ncbi:hypothetical protein KAH94_03650 [bacterium]|nr:hypothetical protein [bacterium]
MQPSVSPGGVTPGSYSGFFQQGQSSYSQPSVSSTDGAPVVLSAEKIPATTSQVQPQLPFAVRAKEEAESIKADRPVKGKPIPSELKGIDTLEVDESGGNWLIKRMWWEKAEEKMDKIEEAVDTIMDSRMVFFEKRDQVDLELFDPFYVEIGFDQGQLEEITTSLLNEISDKKRKQEVLERQERSILKEIKEQKKVLKQLQFDVVAIRKLDGSVDEVLTKLVEQINIARKYKKEARAFFKEIGRVLDHDRARELYYKMDASWQSIKEISSYIDGTFTQHFEKIIKNAQLQIDRIKKTMDDLEQKGLSFKEQFRKIRGEEEKEKKEKIELATQDKDEPFEQKTRWLNSVISMITAPLYVAWNWISSWWSNAEKKIAIAEDMNKFEKAPSEVEEPFQKAISENTVENSESVENIQANETIISESSELIAPKLQNSQSIESASKQALPTEQKVVKEEVKVAPEVNQTLPEDSTSGVVDLPSSLITPNIPMSPATMEQVSPVNKQQ